MEFFDQRYFKTILGGKCVVAPRTGDILDNLKKGDFFDAHQNKKLIIERGDSVGRVDAAKYWFEHTDENFGKVTFDPNPAYKSRIDEMNLWKGFAFEPEENGKANGYLNLP